MAIHLRRRLRRRDTNPRAPHYELSERDERPPAQRLCSRASPFHYATEEEEAATSLGDCNNGRPQPPGLKLALLCLAWTALGARVRSAVRVAAPGGSLAGRAQVECQTRSVARRPHFGRGRVLATRTRPPSSPVSARVSQCPLPQWRRRRRRRRAEVARTRKLASVWLGGARVRRREPKECDKGGRLTSLRHCQEAGSRGLVRARGAPQLHTLTYFWGASPSLGAARY